MKMETIATILSTTIFFVPFLIYFLMKFFKSKRQGKTQMNINNKANIYCKVCKKAINGFDFLIYSNNPYHQKCVKCCVCDDSYNQNKEISSFICVAPGLFFCKKHFEFYKGSNKLPPRIQNIYHKKLKKKLVKVLFHPPTFSDAKIQNHQSEDIFVTPELIQNSFTINRPYEYFLPTVKFHFDISPDKANLQKFQELLGNKCIIYGVEAGSLFIKTALAEEFGLYPNTENKVKEFVDHTKEKINCPLGHMFVGNLVDEPEIKFPDEKVIIEYFNRKSINLLQHSRKLDQIDIREIKEYLYKKIKKEEFEKIYPNENFVLNYLDMYDEVDKIIREDVRKNKYEMIYSFSHIMANKYILEYEKLKKKIPPDDVKEIYLYHGSGLINHQKILKKNFLVKGEEGWKQNDAGWFGVGIYATDNLYYATFYANNQYPLRMNETAYVLFCKAVYNKSKVVEITNKEYEGKEIDSDIKNNYGIHHAVVGSSKNFRPVTPSEKDLIFGEEFVFANKYQIFPLFTFRVTRTDHFILWKDDHIDNEENSEYLNEIAQRNEVNVYRAKTSEKAIEILQLKKCNPVKLITNAGKDKNSFIEEVRKIIGSNFICLVYANDEKNIEWVSEMENVLFTRDTVDFYSFADIPMSEEKIIDFAHRLEDKYCLKFKLNENEMLHFPLVKI